MRSKLHLPKVGILGTKVVCKARTWQPPPLSSMFVLRLPPAAGVCCRYLPFSSLAVCTEDMESDEVIVLLHCFFVQMSRLHPLISN